MKIDSKSVPLRQDLDPLRMAVSLWRHRDLTRQLAWRDLACRCRSGVGGFLWAIGGPLALLAIYTLVFNGFFGLNWSRGAGGGAAGFAITAFCGMAAFFFVSDCLQRAPFLMSAHAGMARKSTVPLQVIPLSMVLAALPGLAAGIGIVVVATAFVVGSVSSTAVLVIPVLLPLLAGVLGACWILAGLGVYFRSCHHLLAPAFNLLLFATPILYDASLVPAKWRILVVANPLAFTVENMRRVLLWGMQPDWVWLGVWALVGVSVLVLGYASFMGMRRGFADVL